MFVTEGAYTRKVAVEVGSAIKYMIEHPDDEMFYELELVRYFKDKPELAWTEWFRPMSLSDNPPLTLADKSEIARCVSKSGRRLDIIFGNENERALQPAYVLLGPEVET